MVIKLKLFSYYAKIIAFICVFTIICLTLHFFICLNINSLKINIHNITKNYVTFKLIYPFFYVLLGTSVYIYSTTLDSSRNILIVIMLCLLILLLSLLSSMLFLRFANFIFAFWLCIISIILDLILSFFFIKNTICNFHLAILFYLSFVLFYFYYAII